MKFHRGDIVKVSFDPTLGHEQANYRPAVVLNDVPLPGGVNICAPITTKQKTYPLEVELDKRTSTQGVVLTFQLRTLDLTARGAKFIEQMPDDLVELCSDYVRRATESIT